MKSGFISFEKSWEEPNEWTQNAIFFSDIREENLIFIDLRIRKHELDSLISFILIQYYVSEKREEYRKLSVTIINGHNRGEGEEKENERRELLFLRIGFRQGGGYYISALNYYIPQEFTAKLSKYFSADSID